MDDLIIKYREFEKWWEKKRQENIIWQKKARDDYDKQFREQQKEFGSILPGVSYDPPATQSIYDGTPHLNDFVNWLEAAK